jgi:hypothetical protein
VFLPILIKNIERHDVDTWLWLHHQHKANPAQERIHRSYIQTAKIVRGILVVTSILRPLAGASTPDSDSSNEYPEIEASACGKAAEGGRLICMVALKGDSSNNTSSRYPTIRRSEAYDARTPSGGLIRNLNPGFNAVRVQAIMKTTQRMALDGSPCCPSSVRS